MINNYVQHQYQPCHLIYTAEDQQNNNIYLGDVSSALDLDFIRSSNIRTVVTAAASMDQVSFQPQDKINHVIYSVLDHKNENLIKFFDQFYQLVQKQLKKGSILVHCAAGISRSSTLVISYLMKKNTWTFKQTIKFVRKSRPAVLPNLGFQRQLKQFQKVLLQQQQRRLKSKTSQSNKHSQNNAQLLPQIGLLGQTSTQKKILQAFRIYKRDDDSDKISKKNIIFHGNKLDARLNILKNQNVQKYKPIMREFNQTKSASLQHAIDRNLNFYQGGSKIIPYQQVRTDVNDISSSGRQIASRNGLFDSAIIPIKYSTVNKGIQKLKKTNGQFGNLNNNNIIINRINIFKQKYLHNNNGLLPSNGLMMGNNGVIGLQNMARMQDAKIELENNILELKTRQNFGLRMGKPKEANIYQKQGQILGINLPNFGAKKELSPILKQLQIIRKGESSYQKRQIKSKNQESKEEKNKKIKIKNFLFNQD